MLGLDRRMRLVGDADDDDDGCPCKWSIVLLQRCTVVLVLEKTG